MISRGQGIVSSTDDSGKQFLDAAAGLWCASLGYASERLARVAYEQMRKLGYYASVPQHHATSPVSIWRRNCCQIAPVPMSKVLFQCSGSEANDTAIKLVWYYHAAIGKPKKRKIIGRKMGYHGSTSASISASGKPDMHADFGLPFPGFPPHRIPALLPPASGRRDRGTVRDAHGRRAGDADRARKVRTPCGGVHRRTGDGRRRRDRSAAHILGEDAGGAFASTTCCSSPMR